VCMHCIGDRSATRMASIRIDPRSIECSSHRFCSCQTRSSGSHTGHVDTPHRMYTDCLFHHGKWGFRTGPLCMLCKTCTHDLLLPCTRWSGTVCQLCKVCMAHTQCRGFLSKVTACNDRMDTQSKARTGHLSWMCMSGFRTRWVGIWCSRHTRDQLWGNNPRPGILSRCTLCRTGTGDCPWPCIPSACTECSGRMLCMACTPHLTWPCKVSQHIHAVHIPCTPHTCGHARWYIPESGTCRPGKWCSTCIGCRCLLHTWGLRTGLRGTRCSSCTCDRTRPSKTLSRTDVHCIRYSCCTACRKCHSTR